MMMFNPSPYGNDDNNIGRLGSPSLHQDDNADRLFSMVEKAYYTQMELSRKPTILPPLGQLIQGYAVLHKKPIRQRVLISYDMDATTGRFVSCPKLHVDGRVAARLLPENVLKRLLDVTLQNEVTIKYNDGRGSDYDARTRTISIKGALDFIHEVGHHAWNQWLIPDDESVKRETVINSVSPDGLKRLVLPNEMLPRKHKEYAQLIGAYNAQFIEDPGITLLGARMNDMDEHFARNYDLFVRGRPLDVTPTSEVTVQNMIEFYVRNSLSNNAHAALYLSLLNTFYGGRLNCINPRNAEDGVMLTRDELFMYHRHRLEIENGSPQNIEEQVALALDVTPDFIRFCLSGNGKDNLKQALQATGITALKF